MTPSLHAVDTAPTASAVSEAERFAPSRLDALAQALFQPMGSDGVYARTGAYEEVVEGLARLLTQARDPGAEVLRFPPVMSRRQLETSGYLKSFPNLLGCVCCLQGDERAIRQAADRGAAGGDWTSSLGASDLVLTPASCYPLYPIVAARGAVPRDGLLFDVGCDCFRLEPSKDLDRLQSFRMREFVRIGAAETVRSFRDGWIARAGRLADHLGLPHRVEAANDPFFGRGGQLMAASQREQALKFELLVPILGPDRPTACMSFNYHLDHFGEAVALHDVHGDKAHTACVAFGMDRLAVALFATHGVQVREWPATVRASVGL